MTGSAYAGLTTYDKFAPCIRSRYTRVPAQFYVAEYSLGKRWTARYRVKGADGKEWSTEYDFKVVGK